MVQDVLVVQDSPKISRLPVFFIIQKNCREQGTIFDKRRKKQNEIMSTRESRHRSRSKPVRRRSSSSHNFGVCAITARKFSENDLVGIQLKEDDSGKYKVSNISVDSIFRDSALQVGDSVLSVNGKSIKELFLEEMIQVAESSKDKVTFVVRQANVKKRRIEKRTNSNPNEITVERKGTVDAGIRFEVKQKKLFVSEIWRDSIFSNTLLKVGDCITKINDMDFAEYANADYALMVTNKKGTKTLTVNLLKRQ